ncbi:MAG: phage/plasmid primase, family [Capsulimonas sp.]|nr:phage/plasmid primase, family [Capsulimonas sp.]
MYIASGVSVIPIAGDGSKAPDWGVLPKEYDEQSQRNKSVWKPFQSRFATDEELVRWFGSDAVVQGDLVRGIGIVGGIVSGHLEILDFDQIGVYDEWRQTCLDHDVGDLIDALPLVVTPSGGRHLYYRCDTPVGKNTKLAMEPVPVPVGTKGAKMIDGVPHKLEVRIETRGEGGQALAPPTPAACHPDNAPYLLVRGNLFDIPFITAEQRRAYHRMAQLFNLSVEPASVVGRSAPRPSADGGLRPGEDYNQRDDFEALLETEGWRRIGQHGDKGLWCRPGKTGRHISATTNYAGSGLFFPFSTSAAPFEAEKSYTPFGVYAFLKHNGNFKDAARDLGKQGFGEQRQPARTPPPSRDADPPAAAGEPEPARPPAAYFSTDTANGRRFVAQHKDIVRYDHSLKCWYVWDGMRWALDETNRVQELAKMTARNIYHEVADCHDEIMRVELAKHAKRSLDLTRLTAMIKVASSDAEIAVRHTDWDRDNDLFNVANGTLSLVTGQLTPHRREDLITRLAPVFFDPLAKCPVWERSMNIWQPEADVRSFIQRATGYTLTGSQVEHAMFYLYGSGGNGKSVFTEIVKLIMGEYGIKSQRETFMQHAHGKNSGAASPEVMALIGKRFVSVSEVQQGDRLNEAFIKDITAEDSVSARALYSGEVNFKPVLKLWMFGNYKPRITADEKGAGGIWRRFLLVPFTAEIAPEDKDKNLFDKLTGELSGILNWFLSGCLEWRRSGLNAPAEVKAATDELRKEQDVIGAFIEDCCYIGPNAVSTAGELYKGYEMWCKDNGEYHKSQRYFGTSLSQRGYENTKTNGVRRWRGVGLLTDNERNYLEENRVARVGLDMTSPKLSTVISREESFLETRVQSDPYDPPVLPLFSNADDSKTKVWEKV